MTEQEKKIVKIIGLVTGITALIICVICMFFCLVDMTVGRQNGNIITDPEQIAKMESAAERYEEAIANGHTILNMNDRDCVYTEECDWLIVNVHDRFYNYDYWEGYRELCPVCGQHYSLGKFLNGD